MASTDEAPTFYLVRCTRRVDTRFDLVHRDDNLTPSDWLQSVLGIHIQRLQTSVRVKEFENAR
jgi:hypothetical protein